MTVSISSKWPAESRWPSVSALTASLVKRLVEDADTLRLRVVEDAAGCTMIDAGIAVHGGIEAGRRIAEICMGGLGRVDLQPTGRFRNWPWEVHVHASNPVLACLGSQYAGWDLSVGTGRDVYHAMGSGPGRAIAAKERLFSELGYRDEGENVHLVLEVDKPPPSELIAKVAKECYVDPRALTLILTPTHSLAGTTQIVARSLEVALHKVHTLGFPLERIIDGLGSAPLPPAADDKLTAMGRTNDAILFGGVVHLFVTGSDTDARELARSLPSSASRDHGRSFAETFRKYDGDFFAIDPMLFSPAHVIVTSLESGRSFHAGAVDEALLDRSFGHEGG